MSTRLIYILEFIVICVLLLASLYFQFFKGMTPCPLCTMQRLSFVLLGIFLLFGIFLYGKRYARNTINVLALLASSLGIFFSARQIWVQLFPSADNSECGVSLQYMLQALPWKEVAEKVFSGTAECTQRGFEFLNMNMAEWSLIWFLVFAVMSMYLMVRKSR